MPGTNRFYRDMRVRSSIARENDMRIGRVLVLGCLIWSGLRGSRRRLNWRWMNRRTSAIWGRRGDRSRVSRRTRRTRRSAFSKELVGHSSDERDKCGDAIRDKVSEQLAPASSPLSVFLPPEIGDRAEQSIGRSFAFSRFGFCPAKAATSFLLIHPFCSPLLHTCMRSPPEGNLHCIRDPRHSSSFTNSRVRQILALLRETYVRILYGPYSAPSRTDSDVVAPIGISLHRFPAYGEVDREPARRGF